MDIVSRVQGILLKPKEEWVKIKEEKIPFNQLFTSYAMILAAIPAVANLIGLALIGRNVPFVGWYRIGMGTALLYGIVSYVFNLAVVYALGIIINALAPTFSSKADMNNAMKLAVFSMTPVWVAGILHIIPFLGWLAFLAGLYGFYILYLGFTAPLMDTPKEKEVGYFVVSLIAGFVLMIVFGMVLGAIFALGGAFRAL
jgi:hypothetical protein